MRRTRHVVLPVRSWQYCGLLVVSLACLTLGLVSRDREGRQGSLVGPELMHTAPHDVDACPNSSTQCSKSDIPSSLVRSASSSTLTRSSGLERESRISSRSRTSPIRERFLETRNDRARSVERRSIEKLEQRRSRSSERRDASTRSRNFLESRVGSGRNDRYVDTRARGQLAVDSQNRRVAVNLERRMSRDLRSDEFLNERFARQSRTENRFPVDETRVRDFRVRSGTRNSRTVRGTPDQTRSREFRIESRRIVGSREKRLAGEKEAQRNRIESTSVDRRRESVSGERRVRDAENRRGRESIYARQRAQTIESQSTNRQQRISTRTERGVPAENYRSFRKEGRSVESLQRNRANENRLDSRVERLAIRNADRILTLDKNRRDSRSDRRSMDARTRIGSSEARFGSRTERRLANDQERRVRSDRTRFGPRIERASGDTERRVRSLESTSRLERFSSRIRSSESRVNSDARRRSVDSERRIREADLQRDSREERVRRVEGRLSSQTERRSVGSVSRARTDNQMERRSVSTERRVGSDERRVDSRADRVRENLSIRRTRSVENQPDSRRERRSVDVERRVRAVGDRADSRTRSRSVSSERRVRDSRIDSQRTRLSTRSEERIGYPSEQLESRARRDSTMSYRLPSTRLVRSENDRSNERRSIRSTGNTVERLVRSESEQQPSVRRSERNFESRAELEARNGQRRARSVENLSRTRSERKSVESRDRRVRGSPIERKATIEKRQARIMENRRLDDSRISRDRTVRRESSDRLVDSERRARVDSLGGDRRDRFVRDFRVRESRNRLMESSLHRVRREIDDDSQRNRRVRNARRLIEVNRQILNLKQGVRQFEAARLLNRREKGLPSARTSEEFRGLHNREPEYFLASQRKFDKHLKNQLKREATNNHVREEYHKEINDRKTLAHDPWKRLTMGVSTDSQYLKGAVLPANQTLEFLRQSIIVAFCAVYGMTIFNSKGGFLRGVSQYTGRVLSVW